MKRFRNLLLGAIGIAAFSFVAFLGSSVKDRNVSLSSLFVAGEADAECAPYSESSAHGKCLTLSQICVFDTEKEECDPYKL